LGNVGAVDICAVVVNNDDVDDDDDACMLVVVEFRWIKKEYE